MTRFSKYGLCTAQTAALILGLTACPVGTEVDPRSNCAVNYIDANAQYGMQVEHNLPKSCPVVITTAGVNVPYAATVKALAGNQLNQVTVRVVDFNDAYEVGGGVGYFNVDPSNPDTYLIAQPNGSYSAGTVRPPAMGAAGYDYANNFAETVYGDIVSKVQVEISYIYGSLAARYPVGNATVNANYTQGVTLTALANPVGTVTYEWYRDGVSLGAPSATKSTITTKFSTVGLHTLEVAARDATGATARWSSEINVSGSGTCLNPSLCGGGGF